VRSSGESPDQRSGSSSSGPINPVSATEAEALFSDWNLVHQSSDPVARIPAEPGMHRLSGHPVALSHVGHGGQTRLLCASTLHPEFRWGRHLTVVMVSLGVFRERYWDRGMLFRRSESAVRIVDLLPCSDYTATLLGGTCILPTSPSCTPCSAWEGVDRSRSDGLRFHRLRPWLNLSSRVRGWNLSYGWEIPGPRFRVSRDEQGFTRSGGA
jgi:hypothetical protein